MNKKTKLIVLVLIFIIICGLIGLFSFKTFNKYQMWNSHKDYFKQDKSKQKIEDWMNPKAIESMFDVNFKTEFNLDLGFYDKRKPLSEICIEKKLNCSKIIKELNNKNGKSQNLGDTKR